MTKTQNKILKILKNCKNTYIRSATIRYILQEKEIWVSPLDLRYEIKEIRRNGYPIIANKNGYCFTTKEKDFNDYINARRKELKSEAIILNTMKGLW